MKISSKDHFEQMELTSSLLAELFGTTEDEINSYCASFIKDHDLSFSLLTGERKEQMILSSLKFLETDKQKIGEFNRVSVWQNGWQENLDNFKQTRSLSSIIPKFIRPRQILRLNREFIETKDTYFELRFIELFHLWFFNKYLQPYATVFEFGCGSGLNCVRLCDMFPNKLVVGCDFVDSSISLINTVADECKFNLKAKKFNMLEPDYNLEVPPNSCAFTFGAIEQLAGNFQPFLSFLKHKRFAFCFHIEPTVELYDEDNLIDFLAIKFHNQRGYTSGFLPYLQKLHNSFNIDLKYKRMFFGNSRMEGYNYMLWSSL